MLTQITGYPFSKKQKEKYNQSPSCFPNNILPLFKHFPIAFASEKVQRFQFSRNNVHSVWYHMMAQREIKVTYLFFVCFTGDSVFQLQCWNRERKSKSIDFPRNILVIALQFWLIGVFPKCFTEFADKNIFHYNNLRARTCHFLC